MYKDFDKWNNEKKAVDKSIAKKFFHEREIWWCVLGINIGHEQNGVSKDFQRPILIYKRLSKDTCLVIQLTTSERVSKYRISIGKISGKNSALILSQIRVIDVKRLVNKITTIPKAEFLKIRKSVKDFL